MAEPDFNHINSVISRAGAEWQAGKTSHSEYYDAVASSMSLFGLAFDPEKAKQQVRAARTSEPVMAMVVAPPPPRIDWRNVKGKSFVTPIRDQQSCGACVSFATCAVLESRMLIAANTPGRNIDLSEAHLFFCGTPNACQIGWIYEKAMDQAKRSGVGLEPDFPYQPQNQACRQIKPVVKVKSYETAASSTQRKRALMRGPVVGGLQVYKDFFTYKSGVYQHVTGSFIGWHAVAIVGYDDVGQYWIAKNSWGPGWGENGFFRIRYGDSAIDSQVLFYDPDITILNAVAVGAPDGAGGRASAPAAGTSRKAAAKGGKKAAGKAGSRKAAAKGGKKAGGRKAAAKSRSRGAGK
jgi:hypothetical protein